MTTTIEAEGGSEPAGNLEWRLFTCDDCDEDNPYRFAEQVPADAVFDWSPELEFCPRCDGHGGFSLGKPARVEGLHGEEFVEWLRRTTAGRSTTA